MIKERMSVMEIVAALAEQRLVLPLFQRPFLWSEEQVCDLFDSLWQGYPVGNILLLDRLPGDLQQRLQCCPFQREAGNEYLGQSLQQRRREARLFAELPAASHLVLDGQQRLFAFYIGIAGAYLRPPIGAQKHERAKLYFDLYPLLQLFFASGGNLEALRAAHHQFRFYSEAQLAEYRPVVQRDLAARLPLHAPPLLPLSLLQKWGRDRRRAKSDIRHFLKRVAQFPKALSDELEDMLDNLHHDFWLREPIDNRVVTARNSYDLLEIFSRLNQGSSLKASDLHYAIRIVFPEPATAAGHNFSAHLGRGESGGGGGADPAAKQHSSRELGELSIQDWHSEIFRELNPKQQQLAPPNPGGAALEEKYEQLLQTAAELNIGLDFFYHCYLFCEVDNRSEIMPSLRKRDAALALRNNGRHLLHFAEVLEPLRDAIDSCNFIVQQWFANNLHNRYTLLPVLSYFYKKADTCLDPLNDLHEVDLARIVRWLALNELAPALFRGGFAQLAKLWPVLQHSMRAATKSIYFPLQSLRQDLHAALASKPLNNCKGNDNSAHTQGADEQITPHLTLSDSAIIHLLENTKIKHRACLPLLALLYAHPQRISLMQRYEERQIDFIQPQKLLHKRLLKTYNLTAAQVELFFARRDSVLNLQWLPKRLQAEKGAIPLRQWLGNSQQLQALARQNKFTHKQLLHHFLRFHHIEAAEDIYALKAFDHFLRARQNRLYLALKQAAQDFGDWDLQAKLTPLAYPAF